MADHRAGEATVGDLRAFTDKYHPLGEASMDDKGGHIVETAVEARGGFLSDVLCQAPRARLGRSSRASVKLIS
jgi:hypothetical protein